MSNIDSSNSKAKHGELLANIAKEFVSYLNMPNPKYLVREAGYIVPGYHLSEMAKFKVVGVMDFIGYSHGWNFDEISPKSVKKIVTGDGNATKHAVAEFLPNYVGTQKYKCDDESDAVAVGISWLIRNGYIESKAVVKPPKKK